MPDTNMRPFEVGDRVQWMRARGQPLGTVLKPSEPEVGFEGPACFVQLDCASSAQSTKTPKSRPVEIVIDSAVSANVCMTCPVPRETV